MPLQNFEIANVFTEIAELLDIQGANPFRSRAYRNAAMTVRDYGPKLTAIVEAGEPLPKLPNIGADLNAKIVEIATTGKMAMLQRLRSQVPPGLIELLRLPGLGPKRVRALWKELGVSSPDDLRTVLEAGKLQTLRGFGARFEEQLRRAVDYQGESQSSRMPLGKAAVVAERFVNFLQNVPGARHATTAGSLRRGLETVGDIDLIVTAEDSAPIIARFLSEPDIGEVLANGTTKASVRLANGMQVDLRVVPEESYGAALHYFTGSKAHNVAVRRLGQRQGLKVNEYGVFRGPERIAGDTEESVFAALGLPYIPPELRENNGEVEAAQTGTLPRLISRADMRGDLHCHTFASDGRDSLAAMAAGAQARGLAYLAITEHSRSLTIAHGLDEQRLTERLDEIDALNSQFDGFTLLKGAEVDILEDGSLDYPNELLGRLDIVVASVHSRFGETRAQQTRRILRAMNNKYVTILGHPTGRRMPRQAYELDMERVIKGAKDSGCVLEVNSQPERLDLNDAACKLAKESGVLVSIDSDAHSVGGLDNVRYGLAQARRAGLEAKDVLNTWPLGELQKFIARRRA